LAVWVLDKRKKPLMPRSEKRTRRFSLAAAGPSPIAALATLPCRLITLSRGRGADRTGSAISPSPASLATPRRAQGRSRNFLPASPRCSPVSKRRPARRRSTSRPHDGPGTRLWRRLTCRSRLRPAAASRATARCSALPKTMRSTSAGHRSCERLFPSRQCRPNQRQVLQAPSTRGRLWLATRASSPGRSRRSYIKRGRLG
jgi:hypothetical protein